MTPAPENSSGAGVFVVGTEGSDPSVPPFMERKIGTSFHYQYFLFHNTNEVTRIHVLKG